MKQKTILLWAIFFIVISIVFGAFGAHALKSKLTPESLLSFETGIRYQMFHGLGLLIIGGLASTIRIDFKLPVMLLILGTLFFSFSIYLLSLQEIVGVSFKFLWPVTPIGGVLMIVGWSILGLRIWKIEEHD